MALEVINFSVVIELESSLVAFLLLVESSLLCGELQSIVGCCSCTVHMLHSYLATYLNVLKLSNKISEITVELFSE